MSEFLKILRPGGPHLLCSIPAEGGNCKAQYFETEDVEAWVEENNPGCGIYYHAGVPPKGAVKKLSKDEVVAIDTLWADVDPGEKTGKEIAAMFLTIVPDGVPGKPTILVPSGGGCQGLWQLNEPIRDIALAERANRFLAEAYGGDKQAWNADRLLRLPGTINYPSPAKRKKGQEARRATFKVIGEKYDFSQFTLAPPAKTKSEVARIQIKGRVKEYNAENLPEMDEMWKDLIIFCEKSWHYEDRGYPSRSEVVIGAVRYLLEKGEDPQVIFDILLSKDLAISGHVYDQEFVERYARRQIEQAMRMMATPEKESPLDVDDKGKAFKTLDNVVKAANALDHTYCYNEMLDASLVDGRIFQDYITTQLRLEVEKRWNFHVAQTTMAQVIEMLCQENQFHPVRTYIRGLPKWDGVRRVDSWLIEYCGAEDTEFNRVVGRIVLVAAVRRVMKPGCKFDEMLILEGAQGVGKSLLLGQGLVPNPDWFNDHLTLDRRQQEFIEDTLGHWIIECSELSSMRKTEVNSLKATLSRQVDKARLAYARSRTDRPRQFIIIGSTNEECYLVDDTGNRRFWPVRTSGNLYEKVKLLAQNRDQIWAEAYAMERRGESISLPNHLRKIADDLQHSRLVENTYNDSVGRAVGNVDGWLKMSELLRHLAVPLGDGKLAKLVASALREHGFMPKQMKIDNRSVRVWARGEGKLMEITFVYGEGVEV